MNNPMKTHPFGKLSVLALPLLGTLLGGCSGAYWGNLIVLGVSFGIFYGTLSLGRTGTQTRTQPEGAFAQAGGQTSGQSVSGNVPSLGAHSVPPPANT